MISDEMFEHLADMIFYSVRDFEIKNKKLPDAIILSKDGWTVFKTGFDEDQLKHPTFRGVPIFVSNSMQGVMCCERMK